MSYHLGTNNAVSGSAKHDFYLFILNFPHSDLGILRFGEKTCVRDVCDCPYFGLPFSILAFATLLLSPGLP